MKKKYTFEVRIVHKNSLALMGHHAGALTMYPIIILKGITL